MTIVPDHPSRLLGTGPRAAARQGAALFAVAGVLALVGILNQPEAGTRLLMIAATDLVVAATAWSLPWHRWGRLGPLLLAVPAFVVLGFSTWAFGGMATGTGPFFVLVFAWLGLHFPPWAAVAMAVPAAVAYIAPLLATGQPPAVVSSAVILLPVAVGVALLIAAQAGHLRRDRQRIERVERWRATLTAALAHDLRSPLTTVQLVLEELRGDSDVSPHRRDELSDAAIRQVARISRLTSGLLDLDRIETHGRLRLHLTPVPVGPAAREAAELLNTDVVQVRVEAGLTVVADPERLEQILVNLIGNALRHGAPPVVVCGTRDGPAVRIAVRDHGPGVPAEARERLFTRFGAVDEGAESVGLGLWIVRQLVHAHGGEVHHEPATPGAVLVVTLPAGGADQADAELRGVAHGSVPRNT